MEPGSGWAAVWGRACLAEGRAVQMSWGRVWLEPSGEGEGGVLGEVGWGSQARAGFQTK